MRLGRFAPRRPPGDFPLHRVEGFPVNDRLVILTYKILRQLSAIVKPLFLHMIVGVELLKQQIARVFLVFQAIPHK